MKNLIVTLALVSVLAACGKKDDASQTAQTPKRADNTDVPAKEHGPDIEWFMLYGSEFVDVQDPTFESDFNKDVVGAKVGGFGLCATVKGVTGCLAGGVVTSW